MNRRLAETAEEVIANFRTFIKLRNSKKQEERDRYGDFLRKAKILVVEQIDGQREYAPSRFIGYRRNTLAGHDGADERDGTRTTPQLEAIYQKWVFDEIEAGRYVRFCSQHGITREVSHLNTPLKFIFSPAYKASKLATRSKPAQQTEDEVEDAPVATAPAMMDFPRNQILYGPPGTGKTYHTATRAVGIIEELTDAEVAAAYPERGNLRRRYEEYQQASRIQFVTFHQAFGYEDFVEGIKPNVKANELRYRIEPGIFRTMAAAATAEKLRTALLVETSVSTEEEADFDQLFDDFITGIRKQLARGKQGFMSVKSGREITIYEVSDNMVWYRYSDAKNHHITRDGLRPYFHHFVTETQSDSALPKYASSVKQAVVAALLNLRKKTPARVYVAAEPENTAPRFVLVIDEINRGNVANIFGELITLLEDDKRAGQPEALTVKLPYSKEDFTVPDNLYLLGTMNTADRSVEALDTALRRRFSFDEMRPEADVLRRQVGANGRIGTGDEAVDVALLLEVLNSRLEQLLDRDHCLGHALLLPATDTLAGLREVFNRKILPLLQEYFFGDFGKIGLVLGERFVTVKSAGDGDNHGLAKFAGYDKAGLNERKTYRLRVPGAPNNARPGEWSAADFQSIYAVPTA